MAPKKDSVKTVKTSKFVLVMWSKKVRGKVAFSVQPDATVKDSNQFHNPRIEAEIEDRISLSTKIFSLHLDRVLCHGTKSMCNNDAMKRIEEFSVLLEKESKQDEVSESDSEEDKDDETEEQDENNEDEEEDLSKKNENEDQHETEKKDEREKYVNIEKIKRKLQETKTQFENYKQITKAELEAKDVKIAKLIKLNLFLQTTLPEKIEETARSSKSNKAAEPIAEWNDEVISTVAKLNLNPKQVRELKSKYKSSLLARACLTFCFPSEVLAKSVVKGGNQQLSKDEPKLDEDKVDDICEFVMGRFPESDRKNILNTLGYKVQDLKQKGSELEKSTDAETE
ncbi:hypothetical protein OUZ56_005612 [Daphnia magna]|uniref:BEN domain-containing protein n=1 Tax=Daphnia magna TaxID=35525 RepID=A0ABQ9YT89_9CRUS|nr:hypothetical protein OUZ56_005612 [Daphnia magna]